MLRRTSKRLACFFTNEAVWYRCLCLLGDLGDIRLSLDGVLTIFMVWIEESLPDFISFATLLGSSTVCAFCLSKVSLRE